MTMSSGSGRTMYGFLACTASQFMTPTVITVERQTTIGQLGALFEQHDFNAFPMMEDGQVLGLVTKFDFLRTFAFTSSQMVPHYDDLMSRRVADVMTEAIVHVDPALPLTRVLQLMVSLKMRSLPVITADGRLAGVISREDVMRALRETTAAIR
jgi:CBS domain-containing protein